MAVPLVQHLADYLAERTVLLVLDNFEQVLSGASVVAELLAAGTGTRIVVTSRAPLRLSGEQELPVPPLSIPDQRRDGVAGRRWRRASRRRCSWLGPAPSPRVSRRRGRTRRLSRASSAASMACRSRSNWRRRGPSC